MWVDLLPVFVLCPPLTASDSQVPSNSFVFENLIYLLNIQIVFKIKT